MLARLLAHLRAQWMGALALGLVLAGGTAYATHPGGANTISSADIINQEVKTADIGVGEVRAPDLGTGQVTAPKLAAGAVGTNAVANNRLTGADIADRSGVDTCPAGSERIGELCVRVANLALPWLVAIRFCGDLELHLPTATEGVALASNHEIPGVDSGEFFWTDEFWVDSRNGSLAGVVSANGLFASDDIGSTPETVCVTTPIN